MSALQIVGTLLAIPVGVASGYSVYRTSFSVEATCRSLRANIVAMLDKNVDVATRRMLVRRDIEAFDQSCAEVDPDGKAAFTALLSADKAAAPVAIAPAAEAKPKEAIRKAEPRPPVASKHPIENTAAIPAEAEPSERDAAASDAAWLAAVRHALVSRPADRKPAANAAKSAAIPLTPTGIKPIAPEVRAATGAPPQVLVPPAQSVVPPSPAPVLPPAIVVTSAPAPALPPAIAVTSAPAPKAEPDHPVPPAPIPELTSSPDEAHAAVAEERPRSRFRQWIANRLRF